MLRYTGAICGGLGLLWFGPTFAQEAQSSSTPPVEDPLTTAWFDTVQSIGVLEGLSRQLDVRRPGAVDNLMRNTEAPLGDIDERQRRLNELELEIARLRSELDLFSSRPAPVAQPTEPDLPRAPQVETRTVGLDGDARKALLRGANGGGTGVDAPATREQGTFPPVMGTGAGDGSMVRGVERVPATGGEPSIPIADPAHSAGAMTANERALMERLAQLEAELSNVETRLAERSALEPRDLPPIDPRDLGGSAGLDLPPLEPQSPTGAGRMTDVDPDSLPTTLQLGPLEAAPRTGYSQGAGTQPIAGNQPTTGAWRPTDAGTRPIGDRVDEAERLAAERAAAQAEAVAARMRVEGYSADPVRQGRAAYLAGDYERAVTLLAAFPDRIDALYWQGRSLEKLDRVPEALKALERVAADEQAGELAERAQLDVDFLKWKWEHNEAFESLRNDLEARRNG